MEQRPKFLSPHEFEVFRRVNAGMSNGQIAKDLDKSESNIRKTKTIVSKKIKRELEKIANLLRLDTSTRTIHTGTGILTGFDWIHNTLVYIILAGGDIVVWYVHDCSPKCETECRTTLNQIQTDYGVRIEKKGNESRSILQEFKETIAQILNEGA
ncbi:MAG: LuxR C-terminal-related transcriptional regulator [Candidatus Thorarchaeota archaeon]